MAEETPSLIPSDLIDETGTALTERLTNAARQGVEAAIEAARPVTIADLLAILDGLTETLPPLLAAEIAAALPEIAAAAIERAQVEIAQEREESGQPFPEIPQPEAGDYTGWTKTAAADLLTASREAVEQADSVEAATIAVLGSISAQAFAVMAETAAARSVNEARLKTLQANSDVVKKLEYVAIRDNKTSEVCQYLDNASFSITARNIPRPPVHNACRSYLKPVVKPISPRQAWAIARRLERKAKAEAEAAAKAQAETEAAEGRAAERLEFRFAPDLLGEGTFAGTASAYGVLDAHGTEFRAGAFAESLAERAQTGHRIPILLHHDPVRVAGVVTTMEDTPTGLLIEGRFLTDTADGRDGYALAKAGAVALSVGFKRLADLPRPGGGRIITKARLAEVSLVAVASNPRTTITEVRSKPAAGAANHEEKSMTETTAAPAGAEETRASVASLTKRLDQIEARAARLPLAGETGASDDLEKRAFTAFVRSGREAMQAEEVRALRASDSAAGGVTVPPGFAAEMLRKLVENSPIRRLATVTQVSTSDLTLPKQTAAPTAAWVAETGTRPATEPAFAQVKIDVHEAGCYVDVSQRLLEDSAFNIESELSSMLAAEFAHLEGLAFLRGSGSGQPRGILTHPDFIALNNGHATNLSADALIELMYSLAAPYRNQGVWLANGTTIGKLRTLKDSGGNYLWRPSLAEGSPETLLGRPIVEAVDLDSIAADEIPILFGDFRTAYRIADRVGVSLLRDPYSVATTGLVRFHARIRVGGDVVMPHAVKGLSMAV